MTALEEIYVPNPACSECSKHPAMAYNKNGAVVWLCGDCVYKIEYGEAKPSIKDKRGLARKQKETLFQL